MGKKTMSREDIDSHVESFRIESIQFDDNGIPISATNGSKVYDVVPVVDVNAQEGGKTESVYRPAFKK